MAEAQEKLISLLQEQMEQHREAMRLQEEDKKQQMEQHREAMRLQEEDKKQHREEVRRQMAQQKDEHEAQMAVMREAFSTRDRQNLEDSLSQAKTLPEFSAYDSTGELWSDYWDRFLTFCNTHSVPKIKQPDIFLTSQSRVVYKLLSNLARQQQPSKHVYDLDLEEMVQFMGEHYSPKRFIVRDRFNYWSRMTRKPGESVQELAARIREEAVPVSSPPSKIL